MVEKHLKCKRRKWCLIWGDRFFFIPDLHRIQESIFHVPSPEERAGSPSVTTLSSSQLLWTTKGKHIQPGCAPAPSMPLKVIPHKEKELENCWGFSLHCLFHLQSCVCFMKKEQFATLTTGSSVITLLLIWILALYSGDLCSLISHLTSLVLSLPTSKIGAILKLRKIMIYESRSCLSHN